MTVVSASDAKTGFSELLNRVAEGEQIIITRRGKPLARMVPESRSSLEQTRDAVDRLFRLRERIAARIKGQKPLSEAAVRSAIQVGRR